MKEYKILTFQGKGKLKSKFDSEAMEHSLNEHAKEGWCMASSNVTFTQFAEIDKFYIFLERDAR